MLRQTIVNSQRALHKGKLSTVVAMDSLARVFYEYERFDETIGQWQRAIKKRRRHIERKNGCQ